MIKYRLVLAVKNNVHKILLGIGEYNLYVWMYDDLVVL